MYKVSGDEVASLCKTADMALSRWLHGLRVVARVVELVQKGDCMVKSYKSAGSTYIDARHERLSHLVVVGSVMEEDTSEQRKAAQEATEGSSNGDDSVTV